jgi:Tfp pilus assembly protein PilV
MMRLDRQGLPEVGWLRTGVDGDSLVEIIVCLALAAVIFLGIDALLLRSRRTNDAADKYRIANGLVRDRLEQLISLRFEDLRLSPGFHPDDLPASMPDPATGGYPSSIPGIFRRSYHVRQLALPPVQSIAAGAPFTALAVTDAGLRYDYKRIDVTVELSVTRPGFGLIGARVSGIRSNPAPEEILSEASADR